MSKWVIPLSSPLPERLVGRKAAALGRLIEAGFPVPAGLCITTEAFHAAASTWPEALRVPDGLLEALTRALPTNGSLAVRSSAVLEDLPETSLAGRYTTHLNVAGAAALEEAVLDCWQSYLTSSVDVHAGGIAVLVQPMLDAESAGVCFTVDPVRLRPDLLLVVGGWGLGIGVANGSVPTDTARLRRIDLQVDEAIIGNKHSALYAAPSGGGVAPRSVPEDLRATPCLPDEWLRRVGQFGLAIEQVFGEPQDVEWAVAGGQLWILQSRPVTALPDAIRAAARFPIAWESEAEARHYWWLERARGSAGSPLLPAELGFLRINHRGGQDGVYYGGHSATRWRRQIHGRDYMARADSPHPPGHVRVYGAALRDLYERLARQDVTAWEYWGPEIVRATGRLAAFDARGAAGPALADHLEDAVATAARHWMIHVMVPRPIASAALLELYARLTGRPQEDVAADIPSLLAGAETIQTRLVEALYQLACLALKDPAAARAAVSRDRPDKARDAAGSTRFAEAFDRLMSDYGDRLCYRPVPGYPVDLPLPWREAPEHVWEMVAAYLPLATQGGPDPRATRLGTLRSAQARIEALCAQATTGGADPALIEGLRAALAYARRNAAYLDEHNHYIDQVSEGQYYQALLHAGRWLAQRGCLPGPFEVFWLHTDEVLAALRGSGAGLEGVVAERRAQFEEWRTLIPPACLGLPIARLPDRPKRAARPVYPALAASDTPGNQLSGQPASRGHAAGRARLVVGDALPAEAAPGDVLVASFAGPALTPILPATAALVLDAGSPGDHFAITAREFGVPVVCGTLQATRRIPQGAWVTVDADAGLVTWA